MGTLYKGLVSWVWSLIPVGMNKSQFLSVFSYFKGYNYAYWRVYTRWKLENVWKHKSCLDPQIKITARLILL